MSTATAKKCAHPSCTGEALPGKEFCSQNCASPQPSGQCHCEHSGCKKKGLGSHEDSMEKEAGKKNSEIIGEGNNPHVPHPGEGEMPASYYVNV
jgi:hypothetical protein